MPSKCYVPGCQDAAVIRFKYRDSMGDICTEARCPTCGESLQKSDQTEILEEVPLIENPEPRDVSSLTESEKAFIRRITNGPYSQFAI